MKKEKPILEICVGMPGIGKSTYADSLEGFVKCEADQQREIISGPNRRIFYDQMKDIGSNMAKAVKSGVWSLHHAKIEENLRKGNNVVVSDTNIFRWHREQLRSIGIQTGAQIRYKHLKPAVYEYDEFRKINDERVPEHRLPEAALKSLWKGYVKEYPLIEKEVEAWNIRESNFPRDLEKDFFVFDIDGTLSTMVSRGPFDWKRVGEDKPITDVCLEARRLITENQFVMFWSGRDESCREETIQWLITNVHPSINHHQLMMRPKGSYDPDWWVKYSIMNDIYKRTGRLPKRIYDDRQAVVNFWHNCGLTVWQVAQMWR